MHGLSPDGIYGPKTKAKLGVIIKMIKPSSEGFISIPYQRVDTSIF